MDAFLPTRFPFHLHFTPLAVLLRQFIKPAFQLSYWKLLHKTPNLFCFQIAVCHLHRNHIQFLLTSVNRRITLRLCQMQQIRLFHSIQTAVHPFYLIHRDPPVLFQDTVCPSFYEKCKRFFYNLGLQRNFRSVSGSHAALYFPVYPASELHGFLICHTALSAVNVAAVQQKLHQRTYRYPKLFHLSSSPAISVSAHFRLCFALCARTI